MSDKWKTILRSVAPALGTAIGGPFGGLAVKAIADKFMGKPDATEDEVATAVIAANPSDLLKLKELDAQFEKDMKALDVDIYKIEVADRSNAREMYKITHWPQVFLSFVFIGGYFAVLVLLIMGKVATTLDANWTAVVTTIVGVLTAAIPQILAYWFGSSSSGARKDAVIAASAPPNGNGNGNGK